jgi:hypothetical protein
VLQEAADAIAATDPGAAAEIQAEAPTPRCTAAVPPRSRSPRPERAVELAPPDEPRARCLAAIALGAAYVLNGRAEAADWLAEAAALIEATPALRDDVRLAALLGVPPTFLRTDQAGYAPLRRRSRSRASAAPPGCCRTRSSTSAWARSGAAAGPRPPPTSRRAAPRRRDRAARRRRHLPRRARAGVRAPRRPPPPRLAADALAQAGELAMPWFEAARCTPRATGVGRGALPEAVARSRRSCA